MARKFKKADKSEIESIVRDSLKRVGIEIIEDNKVALLIRLIASGIAQYFFYTPDNIVDVGFVRFKKNPEKEELFAVDLIKDEEVGIINADTLYRYYTGNLNSEKILKETMEGFVSNLLDYSQSQSDKISELTVNLKKRRN